MFLTTVTLNAKTVFFLIREKFESRKHQCQEDRYIITNKIICDIMVHGDATSLLTYIYIVLIRRYNFGINYE